MGGLVGVQQRYSQHEKKYAEANMRLTEEYKRITEHFKDLQAKFSHFQQADLNKYQAVRPTPVAVFYFTHNPAMRIKL